MPGVDDGELAVFFSYCMPPTFVKKLREASSSCQSFPFVQVRPPDSRNSHFRKVASLMINLFISDPNVGRTGGLRWRHERRSQLVGKIKDVSRKRWGPVGVIRRRQTALVHSTLRVLPAVLPLKVISFAEVLTHIA
jgi:hypothetical protein